MLFQQHCLPFVIEALCLKIIMQKRGWMLNKRYDDTLKNSAITMTKYVLIIWRSYMINGTLAAKRYRRFIGFMRHSTPLHCYAKLC